MKRLPPPTEAEEMKLLAKWLDAKGLLWCHVPNEQRHRRTGVKAGVPDVLIFDVVGHYGSGVAIEIKRRKPARSVVAHTQQAWLDALATRGWRCTVAYGADDAIVFLEGLGF